MCEELEQELNRQKENLNNNLAPTEEIEHEWLVSHQNQLDYERELRVRKEIIAAQVPGARPTQAKPRFDSYVDVETGLPKPYGANVPLQPQAITINQQRFVKKPRPLEIEL